MSAGCRVTLLHERSDQHAKVHGAGGEGGRKQSQHEGRLGERGDGHVAACAHATEWTAGVQRCGREREATQRQGPTSNRIPPAAERGREHHWHQRGGGDGRGELRVDPPHRSTTPPDRTGSFRNSFARSYSCRSGGP